MKERDEQKELDLLFEIMAMVKKISKDCKALVALMQQGYINADATKLLGKQNSQSLQIRVFLLIIGLDKNVSRK